MSIPQYLSNEPHPVPFHWVGIPQCMSGPNMGDLRTRGDLPKFVFTPQGGRWAQGATAGIKGTKAPVPPRVQVKEESQLRFASLVAMTADE